MNFQKDDMKTSFVSEDKYNSFLRWRAWQFLNGLQKRWVTYGINADRRTKSQYGKIELALAVHEWCGCFVDLYFLLIIIHRDGNVGESGTVVLITYITIPHNISDTFEGAWAEWLGCFADLVFCSWLHVESHVVSFLRWSTQRETS